MIIDRTTKNLKIEIEQETLKTLSRYCRKTKTNRNQAIIEAIEEWLKNRRELDIHEYPHKQKQNPPTSQNYI